MTIGSLFSGVGGLELGLEWAGLGPVLWQVEIDPLCRRVLAKHWPNAERYDDVTRPRNYPYVDVLCGGFPCQDVSSLGKGRGLGGARSGLWHHFASVIDQVQPGHIVVENVASGLSRWLRPVRHQLHVLGYRTRALRIGCEDVGAPHVRRRIFVVAARVAARRRRPDAPARARGVRVAAQDGQARAPADAGAIARPVEQETGPRVAGTWNGGRYGRAPVSAIRGVDDGLSGQLDAARKRVLGNAVGPYCAWVAGRVIQSWPVQSVSESSKPLSLSAAPMTRDQANAYIIEHHRHHKRVTGHRFIIAAEVGGEVVGVAIGGRPRARMIAQYRHVEVSRLCSAGARNVCSFLYSRCSRTAREMGFTSIFTAILLSESGSSLKAAGWVYAYTTEGGTQDRPSRRREDKSPTEPKQIWAPEWCIEVVRGMNKAAQKREAKKKAPRCRFKNEARCMVFHCAKHSNVAALSESKD